MSHGGIVALAIWMTSPVGPPIRDRDRPVLVVLPPNLRPAPAAPRPSAPMPTPARPFVPSVVPFELPPVELPLMPPLATPVAVPDSGAPTRPVLPPGGESPGPAPYHLAYVEEQPMLLGHPVPRYPELLRQAGVAGRVLFEVVLDTAGRAEPRTLRLVTGAHPLFAAAAAEMVLGSRYRPGRVRGKAVRVLIQVPVVFAVRP